MNYQNRKKTLTIIKVLKNYEKANLSSLTAKKMIAEDIVKKLDEDFSIERGL